jgi:hypothetical protein
MKTFLSTFLLSVIALTAFAQKVKPALNLAKGETYYTVTVSNSTISQTFNGQDVNYTIGMSGKTAFKVIDIVDTVYNMEVSYKSIGMKMQTPQATMDFNSDAKDPQDLPSKLLAALRDKPFLVSISKNGRVLSVKNIDKIMTSVFDGITSVDSTQKAQVKTQFTQSFGEAAFKGNLEQTLAIYPGKKVAKNDTWVIHVQLESTMSANITTTYQLLDITDAGYVIHGDGKLATLSDKVSKINGMEATYALTGTMKSDINVDKKTGWVTQAKLKQDMSGNFNIKDNPQVPGGMTVPMTVHSDVTTTDQ